MSGHTVIRWCVVTEDRIGMVRDIVGAIACLNGDVEAMEVVAKVLYIRFRVPHEAIHPVRERVLGVSGVQSVMDVEKLPFEADEARLVLRVMNQEDAQSDLSFANLVYQSKGMEQVVQMAKAAAHSPLPVLICGESGTGKELIARAVHNASGRRGRRFVPVNCAAIPDALMESEMFGYVDGAFSGAAKGGRPGLFEVADGGTLFLDEVGELNPTVQAKLLRALNDGEIRRVGATTAVHVDVRIIAATNRDIHQLVKTGQFREDLFYRLHVIPLFIPPLRERREDILPLARHFLEKMSRKLDRTLSLTAAAEQRLLTYDFPGNVRELQNLMERASYLVTDDPMDVPHLWLQPSSETKLQVVNDTGTLKEQVRQFEQRVIEQAVRECGSLRAAAKRLGVTHTTLSNKQRRFKPDGNRPRSG
jgi:TyrR family helix-turn-helix protein